MHDLQSKTDKIQKQAGETLYKIRTPAILRTMLPNQLTNIQNVDANQTRAKARISTGAKK